MRKEVLNSIITASAGSGKTHQLVRRYLQLLALGEPPEVIVAMTFTRKAAQEFFERILQKLADLADHPETAKGYVDDLLPPGKALGILRTMIDSMDRLKLGTIDSFFSSITRCFPFELGLSKVATVMDEEETLQAQQEVLHDLLLQLTGEVKSEALLQMLEAWKAATMGKELNSPTKHLAEWFEHLHPFYLEQSDATFWGGWSRLWPDKKAAVWIAANYASRQALETLVQNLSDRVELDLYCNIGVRKWEDFFTAVLQRIPGEPLDRNDCLNYMLSPDRGDRLALRRGPTEWKMNRRKPLLSLEASQALAEVLDVVIGRELQVKAHRTQGRWQLLAKYEEGYARLVRSKGRLAFDDLTWLLSRQAENMDEQERLEELRREWEYRLDSQYRHWLFDEFQDTSRMQWKVMKSLVEEAAMDPEGRRSFFLVGDLKQSLYVFRQAEPELFLEIQEHFKQTRMEKSEPLVTSYRSCPPVLQMVNGVFSQEELLRAWFPHSMHLWSFGEHRSANRVKSLAGCGALLSVIGQNEEEKTEAKMALVSSLLEEIAPLKRGLSCAILTRTNREAEFLSAELRRRLQIEVVCESKVQAGMDNPLSLLLMSVLKLAVHPGDVQAYEHLLMSPLQGWMEKYGKGAASYLGKEVRDGLSQHGFVEVIQTWNERIMAGLGIKQWDEFTEMRLAQVLDQAVECDENGRRDVDDFIGVLQNLSAGQVEQSNALQVMTFHKAKGLEFDVVIMPEIQRTRLDETHRGGAAETLLTKRDEEGNLQWLLDPPQQIWRDQDPNLKQAFQQEKARLAYQSLCRLYVGMTRAKRGLYVILDDKKAKEGSEDALLRHTLTAGSESPLERWQVGGEHSQPQADCWYLSGDRFWYALIPKTEEGETMSAVTSVETVEEEKTLGELLRAMKKPITRKSPSGQESFRVSGHRLLSEHREKGRQLGLLVHELFASISWLDDQVDFEAIQQDWISHRWHLRSGYQEAAALVLSSLQNHNISQWFKAAIGGRSRKVWCEKSFDYFRGSEWVSGVMDRVVLDYDASGKIQAATVLDFKTDQIADESSLLEKLDGYRPQLKLYVEAVSRLTGLPNPKIKAGLIFVSTGSLMWLQD